MYKFFIDRPIFATVIAIITCLAGGLSLLSLPVAQYPEISPPSVSVSATYTGADANVINDSVASVIEEQINGAEDMTYMSSFSSNDGSYSLSVTFDLGRDLDLATVDVQNRLGQAEPKLPEDVKRMGVTVNKQTPDIVMVVNLVSPNETYDDLFLTNYANINLADALARVPGVGKVTVFGAGEYSMRVWLDPARMAQLGVTVTDISNAINEQNTQAPAGQVGMEPTPKGTQFQYTMQVQGRLTSPEQFGDIIVLAKPDGSFIRLKDVARVDLGSESYGTFSRMQGLPASSLLVYQLPGANSLDVARQVRAQLATLSTAFPNDVEYRILHDTTEYVSESIDEVETTLYEAIALVFLVVFLFLQNWRATIIPMVAVPVSLVGTFIAFPLLGFSINTLTLFGLVLAIGIVVDDAIVVVESVQRYIDEEGMSPRDATFKAMGDVAGPVVANSVVLIAVFIPVAFMGGIAGQLYKQFALTLSVSVAISTFNALTLSPALSALILRPVKEMRGPLGWFFDKFNKYFGKLTNGYTATVRQGIRRWALFLCLLGGVFALTGGILTKLPSGFVPDEDQGYFIVATQLPPAASMQRTDAVMRQAEAYLKQAPGVRGVVTLGGFNIITGAASSYAGTMFVVLDNWGERLDKGLTLSKVVADAQKQFYAIQDGLVMCFVPPSIPGMSATGGLQFELQDRAGHGISALAEAAEAYTAALNKRPEIARAFTSFSDDVPRIQVDVDRAKAKTLGVPLSDVFLALQAFLGGYYVNDFNEFGRTYRVMLQAEPMYRAAPDSINQLYVRSSEGQMVPLSTLTASKEISGPEFIQRFNVYPTVELNAVPAAGYSSGQAIAAMEEVAATLPQGFGYEWSGMAMQEKEAGGQAGPIFMLALTMVFLCLCALYESWAIPFSVLIGLPLGVFGAFAGQYLRSFDLNVYAQIGLIMLIGLAAKNAVLIVEYAKEAHEEKGLGVLEAAMEAARLRFRPILMTSIAFILGVVPLVVASGAGAAARQTLGTSVFFGMIAATCLGVLVVPFLFWAVVHGLQRLKARFVRTGADA
ncbi:efflux RND transporter permease subunit [Salidesulfovibrio onnuriiensis]|uniref:efflux RND transporter permease subunit n=1 Tax=Salidesulfovibrio onnuriiensis TaxID=2583823 RepID=UPI0011CC54B8|nr:multidrug efflux RND transporter permease subunit [Salidesulfovibrio onnuriiensis]